MTHPKEFAEGLSIGIIMDGNGRWAKKRGLPRTAGHKKGAEVFKDIANYCDELGVASVYFYAFSTENWKRPLEEVGAIMKLFAQYLIEGFDYKNRNIRIKFLGDRTALDPKLQKMMNELEGDSACKTGMTLNIAINYGGRPEIVRAAQQLAAKAAAGEIRPEDINEQMMSDAMYTAGQKDPDFILRPSGEKRLSNFMLWQAAYSELVEMDVLWPDFTRADLDTAIEGVQPSQPPVRRHLSGSVIVLQTLRPWCRPGRPGTSSGRSALPCKAAAGRTKEIETYENTHYYCDRGHSGAHWRDVYLQHHGVQSGDRSHHPDRHP